MKSLYVITLLSLAAAPLQAMVWQPAPPELGSAPATGHHAHGGRRGGMPLQLRDGNGAEVEMWLPTRVRRPLPLNDAEVVTVEGTGIDNYHLILARRLSEAGEEVALRYHYQQGKPSGESPSALVEARKSTLEIVPAPLTREHQRYLGGKPFNFMLRFNGEALAAQPVMLTTSNGSTLTATSDSEGRLEFKLPDDFVDVQPGRAENLPGEFVLSTEHEQEGKRYHTTLSGAYFVNPSHWRSTGGALAAMFAGMVSGLVVLQRARRAEQEGRG